MLSLLFHIQFVMSFLYQDLFVPNSVFKQNEGLYQYEKVKHYISVAVNFQPLLSSTGDVTSFLNFGPM